MPCLSSRYDIGIGPVINIGILPAGTVAVADLPTTMVTVFPALIDSGATITCISPSIVQALSLRPMGMAQMASATHSIPVNTYLIDLVMPFGNNGLFLPGTQVMEFVMDGGRPFQMLVGRDIICRGTFVMSFDGHFTFCL
jgi:hypothetical protein